LENTSYNRLRPEERKCYNTQTAGKMVVVAVVVVVVVVVVAAAVVEIS
jgi:uncharacterized membrane protein YidH (DUF202 family)